MIKKYWGGLGQKWANLLGHGTLKSDGSCNWFGELNSLIEWFLHADFSDGIITGLTANLLYIFDI